MPKGGHRPLCSYENCKEPHYGKGLCATHYRRWRSSGDPEGGRKIEIGRSLKDRMTRKFLRGIKKLENGCWICETAYHQAKGYFNIQITENGVQNGVKVHRFSYEHFKGKIPNGKLVCHTCDFRACCNPEHLFAGTQSDNVQDMVAKGRGLVGEKNGNTKFTEADVLRIYRYLDQGLRRVEIAKKFGVADVTISHIATGRNWKNLYERRRSRKSV